MSLLRAPKALIVDDDALHARALLFALGKIGIPGEVALDEEEFLKKADEFQPNVCFIDLNLHGAGKGFPLISEIKRRLGSQTIVIVASGLSSRAAIAHAMEMGANDYLVKPLDVQHLAACMAVYAETDKIAELMPPMVKLSGGGVPAQISLNLRVEEVDELGLRLAGKHLLVKGTAIHLQGPLIREISGREHPILMSVVSTWIEPFGQSCGAIAEFDYQDQELVDHVRQWLNNRGRTEK